MNKPICPKKPLKNENPPNEFETIEKVVMVNYKTKELVLVDADYREKVNEDEDMPQYEVDNLEDFGEGLTYLDVLKFKKLLPPEIENFTIEENANSDGYYEYTYLTYKQKKDADIFQKELADFNNRFEKYEKQYSKYQVALKEYEEFRTQERIRKLQAELAKIA